MVGRLERVIEAATALAGVIGAGDIAKLLTDPAKRQLGINRLTSKTLVPDPRQKVPQDLATSGKLLPAYQVIPFDFRTEEVADYLNWCKQSQGPLAVRLITGDSGRGKTRLMVELAGELRDNGPIGPGQTKASWAAGFVDLPALQQAAKGGTGNPYAVPFTARHDLCLIVDYAENKPDDVTRLLKAAVTAMDDGRKELVRIILIARQRTEIFNTILQDSALTHRTSVAIHDDALEPVADPQAFFQHACTALEVPEPARIYPKGLKSETPDCGLLSLTALLAASEGTAIDGDMDQILEGVLNHERQYWKSAAQRRGVSDLLLAQRAHEIVAANLTIYGLQGAIPDIAAGVDLIANIPLLADENYSTRLALVTSIAELYPHPDGRVEGVGLDLLGTHLVDAMNDDIL